MQINTENQWIKLVLIIAFIVGLLLTTMGIGVGYTLFMEILDFLKSGNFQIIETWASAALTYLDSFKTNDTIMLKWRDTDEINIGVVALFTLSMLFVLTPVVTFVLSAPFKIADIGVVLLKMVIQILGDSIYPKSAASPESVMEKAEPVRSDQ